MNASELSELDCDAVVIGAGAAGLSVALLLARRRVVVVDDGSPRNAPAEHMHGFLSREGVVARDAVLTGLGCAVGEDGWVIVDRTGRTSVPGVWAAGNVIDPRALVVISAGMGAAAGFAVNLELADEDVDQAVRRRRAAGTATAPAGGTAR
jgi:thioredoxin reductase